MSVKNGAKDLPKSIGSIQRQTLKDWEFIICDDGSTDGTFQCLKEYQEKDDRIVLLHNDKSMGLAYSLNLCIIDWNLVDISWSITVLIGGCSRMKGYLLMISSLYSL